MQRVKFKDFYDWNKFIKAIISVTLVVLLCNLFDGYFTWYLFLIIPLFAIIMFGRMRTEYKIYEEKNQTVTEIRKAKLKKIKIK